MKDQNTEQARWFVDEVLPQEDDLRGWLNARFPSIQDVDDLVQEAFSRLLKAHDSGPGSLSGYDRELLQLRG
jgi:DNA-directed RNA polymerase specialized sigma24 family protein